MFSAPRRIFMSAFGALLASCASNQIVSTASAVEGASVKNSKIYIYSLLDLRDAEFGPSMLAEVEKLLPHGETLFDTVEDYVPWLPLQGLGDVPGTPSEEKFTCRVQHRDAAKTSQTRAAPGREEERGCSD